METLDIVKPPVVKCDTGDDKKFCINCKFFAKVPELHIDGIGHCTNDDRLIEIMAKIHNTVKSKQRVKCIIKLNKQHVFDLSKSKKNKGVKILIRTINSVNRISKRIITEFGEYIKKAKSSVKWCYFDEENDCEYFRQNSKK